MRSRVALLLATTALAGVVVAAPAQAIVGGKDTAAGAYPAVAFVRLGGLFACTGTLVAPNVVMTAGHCGSLTGAVFATPLGWPPAMIDVTLGSDTPGGAGEKVAVDRVAIPPEYVAGSGADVSLLVLRGAAQATPVRIAGKGEEALWKAGVLEKIVGYGRLGENGPDATHLQEAEVPIVSDEDCTKAYPGTDLKTQICAGYPQGGVDSCQGDSGGPLLGRRADGSPVIVGVTSNGDGCARAGKPGVYSRVADTTLREWVRGVSAEAVDADVAAGSGTQATTTPPAAGGPDSCRPRTLTVNVKRQFRSRTRSVLVLVSGRRVATLRGAGKTSARITLTATKPRTITVKLLVRLRDGTRVTDTRRYRVCGAR